ncbi:MAG: hypothetical protein JXQ69_02335 [Paludibacteraceae bacterium]|nr:hypothetical protein [Paludibacteraceae bacterium]
MEKENKELDLFDLIAKFFNAAKSALNKTANALLWLIRFKLKNWLVLTIFSLIGLAWATYAYLPAYRTKYIEFRVQVNGAKSFQVYDIVQALSLKIDVLNDNKNFAKTIDLPHEVVAPVRSIQPFYVIDLNNNRTPDYVDYDGSFKEDSLNSRMINFLAIRVQIKGNTDFSALQKAIVNYLQKDTYLVKEEKERFRVLNEDIAVLAQEIAALKELREKELLENKLSLSFKKSAFIVENSGYTKQILQLEKEKSILKENLSLQKEVITTYSDVLISNKKTDIFVVASRLLSSVLVGFVLALFITYRKKIKKALTA